MSSSSALVGAAAILAVELIRQFALLADGGEDRLASLIEFAQIAQALREQPQLRVVEPAGCLLAVPRDERNRGAFVQESDGSSSLPWPGTDFGCDDRSQAFILCRVVSFAGHALLV